MSDAFSESPASGHVVADLGLQVHLVGDELWGSAEIIPELNVPGTEDLRVSVLAAWADVLTGVLCLDGFGGRVPVTLDLDIHVFARPGGCCRVSAVSRMVKVGQAIAIAEVEFTADSAPEPFAVGSGSFMATPNAAFTMPSRADVVALIGRREGRLSVPFAERAGCERTGPGIASLARRPDGLNASNTINGGLIALVVEEAALSITQPSNQSLSSMSLRYLRAARVGPIVGTATRHGDLVRVDVRDTGADGRHVVRAMSQLFPA